jgi:tRNA(Arg) A34 adenosine deaminase TadA
MELDLTLLRRSFELAAAARAGGSHPFAALLAAPDGTILLEQANAYLPHHDMTGHAERVLATRACQELEPASRSAATLYSSAEPCAMCAGAIYWSGIGRVVYGLSEARLKTLTGNHRENPTLSLPCRTVFAAGQRPTEVLGPLLEDEAALPHAGAWE